ncbi:MAG: hypothetical protein ABIX01_12175 [Chitinophagaceae bacterium]
MRHEAQNIESIFYPSVMNTVEQDQLTRYIQLLEQKLGWQPVGEWRNYEFNELSEKIWDVTGIQLSAVTLKRVFGKLKYNSLPSSATLNALANFLGFKNWMDFRSANTAKSETVAELMSPPPKMKPGWVRRVLLASAAISATVVALGFIILSKKSLIPDAKMEAVVFKCRTISKGLPNTVVFNFDLQGITSNNMRIQQDWDSTRTIQLRPGQTEASGFYYLPGYFNAKLIIDGKVEKTLDVFIEADQWVATVDLEPVPTYLKKEEVTQNGEINVSKVALNQIKALRIPVNLTYHLVKSFNGLNSSGFTMEASVKNIFGEGPAVCKTTKIFILCTKGAFIIPFAIPGCVGDINLKLNDKIIEGRSNDLSAFGADLATWNKIKVSVTNRQVTIFLNGRIIRKDSYLQDAGEVVGMRFSFAGAGAVDDIRLTNEKNAVIYEEHFDKKR